MRWILILVLLVSCGRPLTEAEVEFVEDVHGGEVDVERVRFHNKAPVRGYITTVPVRPRLTCSERISPPLEGKTFEAVPAAVALGNHIHYNKDYYLEDYLPGYPKKLYLYQAMLVAHEITHVWQWQHRKETGYHPFKAAREHQILEDPYLFDPDEERDFLSFGYEQQASIVGEYVCCAALDPTAPRTERMKRMISKAFPIGELPVKEVYVGWKDVQTKGICR